MTSLRFRILAAAFPVLLTLPAQAMPTGGTCIEGNCEDGLGAIKDNFIGTVTRGLFSGGRFAPSSSYEITDPRHPGQVYRATTDANRNWSYSENWRTETQFYAGTLKTIQNPFTGLPMISYEQGRFEDGTDIVYEGQFEYLPLIPSHEQMQQATAANELWRANLGIFLFSGTRTTKSTGNREYGIFASDSAYSQKPLTFTPADPQRIADIRSQYATAMAASPAAIRAKLRAEQAAQAATGGNDADLIGTLFQAAAGGLLAASVGQMAGGLGGGMSGLNAMNLSQVLGVVTGATSPDQAMAAMTQQYMAQGLGAAIGATAPQDFATLAAGMASGGTVPTTRGALTSAALSQAQTLMQQKAVTSALPGQTTHIPPNAAPTTTPTGGNQTTSGTQTGGLQTGGTPAGGLQTAGTSTGGRIPALEMMTLPCTNENGSFTGQSRVPKAAADCRAEVIAHRKVQCRSDWMTHPTFAAMKTCFQQKGIADLSQWR